jgi:hypothetical protein
VKRNERNGTKRNGKNGKISETKRNGTKRKCQGHETKRNEISVKR